MNRPIIVVSLIYAAGLLLGYFFHAPLFSLGLVTGIFALLVVSLGKLRRFAFWPFLFLAGWTNLTLHTAIISPHDLRTILRDNSALVSLRGRLAETPRIRFTTIRGEEIPHSLAAVDVSALQQSGGNWLPASGRVMVSTPGIPATNFFAGQNVIIYGVIARPPPPLAEGLFDYQVYLQTHGIYYELKTESTDAWQLGTPAKITPPLADRFLNWSRHTLSLGLPVEDEPLRLIWAMTLGWRTAFTGDIGDIGDPFFRAGTFHLFAIDGLRIALVSGMLVALLRMFYVSRAWCGLIAIPLIWFYTAATGWESSAIRASIMMSIVLGGWALKRPVDLLNSLALAAFIILLAEPRQLFEASFQLSFLVMLTIAVMFPPLNHFIDRWLHHDPFIPDDLVPRWQKIGLEWIRRLARYTALSVSAWIGSLPLSIKYFHLFSLISTPANLLAIPLGTFVLMANLAALLTGTWFPAATALFNNAAWGFMVAMQWISVKCTHVPLAYRYVPDISWTTIPLYYLAIIVLFSGWLRTTHRRCAAVVILLVVLAGYGLRWESTRSTATLTILPLNGGQAILATAPTEPRQLLIDCGNQKAASTTLKDFLRAQGINTIPQLILTTGESRNAGGATNIDQLFGIHEIFTSDAKIRSSPVRQTINHFATQPNRHQTLQAGDALGDWTTLYPSATNHFSRADDNAVVLAGEIHHTKILLLSELGPSGQESLLAQTKTNNLTANIVVTGLPTDGQPLGSALLEAIHPQLIVIVDSKEAFQRHISELLRERLGQIKIPVIYTSDTGAVKISINERGWQVTAPDGKILQQNKK